VTELSSVESSSLIETTNLVSYSRTSKETSELCQVLPSAVQPSPTTTNRNNFYADNKLQAATSNISNQKSKATNSLPINSSNSGNTSNLFQSIKPKYKPPVPPKPKKGSINNHYQLDLERQVDQLTELLVKSMESAEAVDFFGMCHKCGDKVIGEGNGCEAMQKVYHDKPFCEQDYLDTLEKCCVCNKAITNRILRATGKAYHPDCFRCEVCNKVLDNVPFTVSTDGKIHCIEDFHKKFAPKCSVCLGPIVPEPDKQETVRVVALDRSFHVDCYRCEDCSLLLSSEADGHGCYPLDGHILCRQCNIKRAQTASS
ncbi:Lipoma-preferred partner-like protein, partial [Fragariocoptes setiger]